MNKFLEECRREIAEELTMARALLAPLEAEDASAADVLTTAERAYREAKAAIAVIQSAHAEALDALRSVERPNRAALAALVAAECPPPLVTRRVREIHDSRNSARGNQARTTSQLQTVRDRIRELESGLVQLDRAINSAAAEDAA